jgi:hypothetical protein
MTVPPEAELVPRRRRSAAARVARLATFTNLTAFFKTVAHTPLASVVIETFDVAGDSPEERKAQADRIAQQMGATAEWCNGYYMATMTAGTVPVEIHSNPPVFASDMTSGERRENA